MEQFQDWAGVYAWELGWTLGVGSLCLLLAIICSIIPPPPRRRPGNRRRYRLARRLQASGQLRRMM